MDININITININIIINPYLVEVGLLVEHCAPAESQIASIDDPGIAGDSDLRRNNDNYNIILYHMKGSTSKEMTRVTRAHEMDLMNHCVKLISYDCCVGSGLICKCI